MKIRKITIALIIALGYEMLLKAPYLIVPSLPTVGFVVGLTSILSIVVAVTIVLFLMSFLSEEGSNVKVRRVMSALIGCMVLGFLLRLPVWPNAEV